MAERKMHKQELPNKKEPTPQEKKVKDLRAAGHSLNEISEMLNISRKRVEGYLGAPKPLGETKEQIDDRQAARRRTSESRGEVQREVKIKVAMKGK